MLLNCLDNLVIEAKLAIMQSNNLKDLEQIRVKFLGKKGYINQKIKTLNYIDSIDQKVKLGKAINYAKKNIYTMFVEQKNTIKLKKLKEFLDTNALDVTLPGRTAEIGTLHPLTSTIERTHLFFKKLGFSTKYGAEVENDYFNFESLNIPKNHPSRDEHDTFWINNTWLLRTHISAIQVRVMNEIPPPMRIISFGKVYRKDCDKNHTPMFHQIEGIMIDTNVNFCYLKTILFDFLSFFFKKEIKLRFRPSYFPFTEPSAEIDANFPEISDNWIELLGCGVIHPKILYNAGIDAEKYLGIAFGIGIERLAMLFYHAHDIRDFFKNDINFLNQFK